MIFESDRIRDAEFEHLDRMEETAELDDNAKALSQFLTISEDQAREIASAEYLFAD